MLPLSICEIKFWGNWNCEFYNWKHLRYSRDLRPLNLQLCWWIHRNTSENLDSTWNSGAVVNFQKETQFYCTKVCYELLDYNTSLTCVFVYFCRTYLYKTVYKTALVSVAILSNALISHEPNRYSYKKRKTFWPTSHHLTTDPNPLLPLAKRDCVTKNFETQVMPRKQKPFRKRHSRGAFCNDNSKTCKYVNNQNP